MASSDITLVFSARCAKVHSGYLLVQTGCPYTTPWYTSNRSQTVRSESSALSMYRADLSDKEACRDRVRLRSTPYHLGIEALNRCLLSPQGQLQCPRPPAVSAHPHAQGE